MEGSTTTSSVDAAPLKGAGRGRCGTGGWARLAAALAATAVAEVGLLASGADLQWHWLVLYCGVLVAAAPLATDAHQFFVGGIGDRDASKESFGLLAASSFISWIFAKSILNASTLGAKYGVVGGLAYAAWYTSFVSAACVIYVARRRFGYRSLPEAINMRYGPAATLSFGAAVLYRLFNEVWSNSMVVADFYGEHGSADWWTAAIVSTAAPALYVLVGGMRSSLLSDGVQAVAALAFLIAMLGVLDHEKVEAFGTWNPAGSCAIGTALNETACVAAGGVGGYARFTAAACSYPTIADATTCTNVGGAWVPSSCTLTAEPACAVGGGVWTAREPVSLEGGMDLLVVGLMQGLLSYPFFDPVLTDRCFLAEPRMMRRAFAFGGTVAAMFIVIFSFLGIYGNQMAILRPEEVDPSLLAGMRGGKPAAIARHLGDGFLSVVNIIFMTSSISTLDSTFTSCAKLLGPELLGFLALGKPQAVQTAAAHHVTVGRVAIVLLAVAGTLPLLADVKALNATTVSGTVVLGLGPPVLALMFFDGYNPLMFHLPFWFGVGQGIVYQLSGDDCCRDDMDVTGWEMGEGGYRKLLGFNVISTTIVFGLCAVSYLDTFSVPASWRAAAGLDALAHEAAEAPAGKTARV